MSPQQPGKPTRESVINDLSWKISNLNTKLRINEQNILNDGKRVQLVNQNFLNFKKEIRDKIDQLLKDNRETKKLAESMQKNINNFEAKIKKSQTKEAKKSKSVNLFKAKMTKEEAKKILDGILEKSKAGSEI